MKKLVVLLFFMVILATAVNALRPLGDINSSFSVQPTYYWSFDTATNGSNVAPDIGEVTLTLVGGSSDEIVPNRYDSSTFGSSFYSDAEGTSREGFNATIAGPGTTNQSTSAVVYYYNNRYIYNYFLITGTGEGFWWIKPLGNEAINVYVGASEATVNAPYTGFGNLTYTRLTTVRDVTNGYWALYWNNTQIANDTTISVKDIAYTNLYVNSFWDNKGMKMEFDDIAIWNGYALTTEDITLLTQAVPVSAPTISNIFPANNTFAAITTQFFNATFNSSTDTTLNLTFYVNDAVNQTRNDAANSSVQNFNLTLDGEKTITWKFQACDSNGCTNTSQFTLKADTVAPSFVSNFVNGSSYYADNITGDFNFSDGLLLHSYNISIDGVNIQGNNSIGLSSLNVSFNYDASDLSLGLHTLNVTVADGHTDEKLKGDYEFSNGWFNDYAEYEFFAPYKYGSIKISQKDSSVFDKWTSEKKTDRYVFNFEPGSKKEIYTFRVEALSKIHIADVPGSKYGKWLIYDDHWLDFMPYQDVSFERVSDNIVDVIISDKGINSFDKLSFNSIGDLNIVTNMYYFYTNNATKTFTDPILSLENQVMTLNLTTHGLNSSAASLVWNNSVKTVTKVSSANSDLYTASFLTPAFDTTSNITFIWYYNLTDNLSIESGNITDYQIVSNIGVDNCSTFELRGINFTVINSSDSNIMNSSAAGFFSIYIDSIDDFKSHNITWSLDEIHSMCIFPNRSSFNMTGQAEFVVGGATKTYYINDLLISNDTQNINIYFEDGTTAVTFTVTDENDNFIENSFITVLRYDFATNTYLVSEILETDSQGNAIGNLVLNTNWYKFIVTYQGDIFLETSPTKIISTTYSFQIVLGSDYFESYTDVGSVSCNTVFNNNSKVFTLTGSDGSGASNTYCLDVWKKTLNTNTIINNSCDTGSSVVINVGISEAVGDNTYTGIGNVWVDGIKFMCSDATHSYNTGFKKYGQEGLFATFLIAITLIMIGIWSPIIAVALMTLGIVISIIMGIFMLTWSMLLSFIILAVITMLRLNKR